MLPAWMACRSGFLIESGRLRSLCLSNDRMLLIPDVPRKDPPKLRELCRLTAKGSWHDSSPADLLAKRRFLVYNRLIIPRWRPAKQVRMTHFETQGALPEMDSTERSKSRLGPVRLAGSGA